MGAGVAMGDFNGDGFPDLFFTGSAASGKKPDAGPCGVLYRNRGDGTFEDVTGRSGIRSCGWKMGASWVDLDGEGHLDLVVTGVGKTELWKNLGNGTFREESQERGLAAPGYAVGLAAGDVNGDGRVDLYVVGYLDTDYAKENSFGQFEVRVPEDYAGQEAKLNVQGEDGRFVERAKEAGVLNAGGRGLSAVFFDYDGDGRPDLYVANDRTTNVLYRNKGDGAFEDVTVEAGAGQRDQKEARAGMGIAIGDLDGDGRPGRPRHELRGRAEDALPQRGGRPLRRRDGVVRRRAPVAPVRPVGDRHRRPRRRRAPRPRHGLGPPRPEIHHVARAAVREQQPGPRPVRARRPQLQAAAGPLPQRGRRADGGRDRLLRRPRATAPVCPGARGGGPRRRRPGGPRDRVGHGRRARPAQRHGVRRTTRSRSSRSPARTGARCSARRWS